MTEGIESIEDIAQSLKLALESANLTAFGDLLSKDVTWGPPESASPPCRNREQVLRWYENGKFAGVRAVVREIIIVEPRVMVELDLGDPDQPEVGRTSRWQIFTVERGHITDIVGFDSRSDALEWLNKL